MQALAKLEDFKEKIDLEIEKYFSRVIKETRNIDPITTEALQYVKKIVLAGGKRLRPALMYYGYIAAGGRESEKMLKTSLSIELIHTFLLIHDDIIDRDATRHGIDSVNEHYSKMGKRYFPKNDSGHFGNSMAIIFGDMVNALGNQVIFESGFEAELVMKALFKLQSIVSYTVVGQVKDIYIEYAKKAKEKEVLKMYEYKTAKYTVEGPLHLGAILGGADEAIIEGLSNYAIPIGVAFQIQDDILGIFGNKKKLGKMVGSDIVEGKQTLLVVKAKEKAKNEQKKTMKRILGNKNLTKKDVEIFREIIRETGALEYAKNLSKKLVQQGKKNLENIQINEESRQFFLGIADYIVERES